MLITVQQKVKCLIPYMKRSSVMNVQCEFNRLFNTDFSTLCIDMCCVVPAPRDNRCNDFIGLHSNTSCTAPSVRTLVAKIAYNVSLFLCLPTDCTTTECSVMFVLFLCCCVEQPLKFTLHTTLVMFHIQNHALCFPLDCHHHVSVCTAANCTRQNSFDPCFAFPPNLPLQWFVYNKCLFWMYD
jgi:hypothetical protein